MPDRTVARRLVLMLVGVAVLFVAGYVLYEAVMLVLTLPGDGAPDYWAGFPRV